MVDEGILKKQMSQLVLYQHYSWYSEWVLRENKENPSLPVA